MTEEVKICDLHTTSEETEMMDGAATHSNPGARGGASEMSLAAISSRPWEAQEGGEDRQRSRTASLHTNLQQEDLGMYSNVKTYSTGQEDVSKEDVSKEQLEKTIEGRQ